MIDLDEQTVFASAVGASLSPDRLKNIAVCVGIGRDNYWDCDVYLAEGFEHWDMVRKRRFHITPALVQKWHRDKILFRLTLYINDGRLVGGRIYRYKITSDDNAYPQGYLTSPTQQEIRLAARILEYLVEEMSER